MPAAVAEESPHPGAEPAPGEETSPGRYKENPDTANFIVLPRQPEGVEGSASSHVSGPERTRFSVYVGGDEAGGSVRAHLTNVSGREMRFVEGLRVVAEVTRDGEAWREFVLADPAITALGPGQEASLQTEFLFEGPGQYSSGGSVEIELV